MSRTDANRNLLLGVLALQMDFIDREQLIVAVNRWVTDKSRDLDQILLDQEALETDAHQLLLALVNKHLELHDNSPAKSLATISSVGSLPEHLGELNDADINASLTLLKSDAHAPGAVTITAVPVSGRTGRFRVLRPHASGGLGKVSVALDVELNREVAYKEIHDKLADQPESRSRFLLEAEITGGLEHPGVVPVYGLGSCTDGRPFYAMRFIKGDSLRDAIHRFHEHDMQTPGQRVLELRKLLGRFIDVCDAVEYAHSRGVLHRDLKPGNIMLGKYGETLVVDWGLAKTQAGMDAAAGVDEPVLSPSSGSGSAPTMMGAAIGTPAYMSPEQATGRLDQLGPRSDVFSLGATLYALLTGRPPHTGTVEEVLSAVRAGDFPPPREVCATTPRALNAICLKAMALDPDQRYASPRQLADDIDRWLGDEPVTAYADPVPERVARWLRHHRTVAIAATLVLLTALSGLTLGTVLLNAANIRTEKQRQAAVNNYELAQRNFEKSLETVDQYLTSISETRLLHEPGLQPLRRELLEHALTYYEEFTESHRDDSKLALQLAHANLRIARITSDIRSGDEARPFFEQAIELCRKLNRQDPDDKVTVELILGLRGLCDLEQREGNQAAAIRAGNQAVETASKLVEHSPDVMEHRHQLAMSHFVRGHALRIKEGGAIAEQDYAKAAELLENLLSNESSDNNGAYRTSLSGCYLSLGIVRREAGDRAGAIKFYQQSLDIDSELVDEYPNVFTLQSNMAKSNHNLGLMLMETGQFEAGLKSMERAVEIGERLVKENPTVIEYRSDLVKHYDRIGNVLRAAGERERAAEPYRRGVILCEALVADQPSVPGYKDQLASLCNNSGNLERELQRPQKAAELYQRAIDLRERLLEASPDDARILGSLATTYNNMAVVQEGPEASVRYLMKGIELQQQLVESFPDNPDRNHELARSYANLSEFERQRHQVSAALAAAKLAVEMEEKLVAAHPAVNKYKYILALALANRALAKREKGDDDDARADVARALEFATGSLREGLEQLQEQMAKEDDEK